MKINTLIPMLVLLFHLSLVSCHKSVNGFALDLIHRDSPLSPHHNPSNTPFERLQNALYRSSSRASFFKKNSHVNSIESTIIATDGEYLMKISIGTPPVDIFAFADTGSDLTWTQCEPCLDCFKQLAPLFNPKNSSSYKTIGCKNELCPNVGFFLCKNDICNYKETYGDNSYTIGELSSETFTFPSTSGENVSIPNIAFGCGHNNKGTFSNVTSGIIGLGGGKASIINQINQQIKGKFSYCLIPFESSTTNSSITSHINFGDTAIVSGPGVVSTPLIRMNTFYILSLESISIGNKTLPFKSSKFSSITPRGNIIIDSGTTLTYVPVHFYADMEKILVDSINATRKLDPSKSYNLCYASENGAIDVPKIVVHFTNADLELPQTNTFVQVDEGLVCFTMVPDEDVSILGNLSQMNFLIGFDLVANKVSFLPSDCTKH